MSGRSLRSIRLQDLGPRVRVRFDVGAVQAEDLALTGGEVRSGLDLVAVLDTGASVTCLPPGTFQRLGVSPTGETWIRSAGDERRAHASYVGRLRFRGVRGETSIVSRAVEVAGLPDVGAIVGRDALSHGRFHYDGIEGESALVLRGTEIPMLDPAGFPLT